MSLEFLNDKEVVSEKGEDGRRDTATGRAQELGRASAGRWAVKWLRAPARVAHRLRAVTPPYRLPGSSLLALYLIFYPVSVKLTLCFLLYPGVGFVMANGYWYDISSMNI